MNPFSTKYANNAKLAVLLEAQQDYRSDLVEINFTKIAEIKNYEFANLDLTPIDIGIPNDMAIINGIKFALINAALQYRFWDIVDGEYVRIIENGKSGALILTELLSSNLRSLIENGGRWSGEGENVLNKLASFPGGQQRIDIAWTILSFRCDNTIFELLIDSILLENRVTVQQAATLSDYFSFFKDPYLKKAQLGLSFIAGWLNKNGYNIDTSNLTVFADYQVPRVMEQMKLITYSDTVKQCIDSYVLIKENSATERAIRAATVLVGNEISDRYRVPSAAVDKWLWLMRNECKAPHHLTETIRY